MCFNAATLNMVSPPDPSSSASHAAQVHFNARCHIFFHMYPENQTQAAEPLLFHLWFRVSLSWGSISLTLKPPPRSTLPGGGGGGGPISELITHLPDVQAQGRYVVSVTLPSAHKGRSKTLDENDRAPIQSRKKKNAVFFLQNTEDWISFFSLSLPCSSLNTCVAQHASSPFAHTSLKTNSVKPLSGRLLHSCKLSSRIGVSWFSLTI